jgi:hypothetical protein
MPTIKAEVSINVNVEFPVYLRYNSSEDPESITFGEDYYEYWKIESEWKITILQEDQTTMSVVTYRDEEFNAFYERVTNEMIKQEDGWEIVEENVYDEAFNRLIDKVTNA